MRVLLAEGQPRVRSALRLLLEQTPAIDVVDETAKSDEVLAKVEECSPDIVLIDWELPGLRAADLIPELHTLHSELLIVVLSSRPESRGAALAAGSNAFISKGDMPERLLDTIVNCERRQARND